MTDLDRDSLDRVLPDSPGSADWNDVMSRFHASRSGARRRRLVMLAATALVAIVGTASAIGGVRDLILDRGFIGLAPEGATPSAPESGDLVVHWEGFTPALPPQGRAKDVVRAWVYADGRIIWDRRPHHAGPERGIPKGANEFNSGYLEQRLTPEGVELVRSAVAGLFERSRSVLETSPASDVPLLLAPRGRSALVVPEDFPSVGSMELSDGDRLLRLGWHTPCHPTDLGCGGTTATAGQVAALRRVDMLVTDPASVLPSSAWAVRAVRAYVPSDYAVCIDTSPPKHVSHLLSLLPARAADLLRGKSRTRLGGEVQEAREAGRVVVLGRSVRYCFKVETEQAREVAEALSGLDPEPGWKGFGLAYRVAEPVNKFNNPTRIWFEPYFPHGGFTFSGPAG
ncbi:MAG TPA: hypothetical protein VFT86_04100 [Gaiellaceae bacterium]|nr:hypothetical protein [Gaiellaceae bacterium]